ncbi:MAG TPA: hypothetical protein PKW80_15355 [Bacteroidales bacterium]|nr:hypothetical protein [Bacteroidales bacterium]
MRYNPQFLNEYGIIAYDEWLKTPELRKNVELDVFIVMPNHIHGIIVITDTVKGVLHTPGDNDVPLMHDDGTDVSLMHDAAADVSLMHDKTNVPDNIRDLCNTSLRSPSQTVGAIVRGYKSSVTNKINKSKHCTGFMVWHRNYHDHIIRNKQSYKNIFEYIINNPAKRNDDVFYFE